MAHCEERAVNAKVFISHAAEDGETALLLKEQLAAQDGEPWSYELDLPFGESVKATVAKNVSECDHFLVILSDAARRSEWVGREIGLALQYRQERGEPHPTIIGVRCGSPCQNFTFQPLDFETRQPLGPPHDFATFRYFDVSGPKAESELRRLAEQLRPRFSILDEAEGPTAQLFQSSLRCYTILFPDEAERDEPENIRTWLNEVRREGPERTPWREIYAVLHHGDHAIGLAYLSINLECHWCFGNYFGVRPGWRLERRADAFLARLRQHLAEVDPLMRGVAFEIDPIDVASLQLLSGRPQIGGSLDEDTVLRNIRCLRRAMLYQSHGALALLRLDGTPLPYWQPSMEDCLDPANERELILMVLPTERTTAASIQLSEMLDFVYDRLYGDAYGGAGGVNISGYREYVTTVKRRVEQAAAQGSSLAKLSFQRELMHLLGRAREEGLVSRLAL
jgi:hypothetical protein